MRLRVQHDRCGADAPGQGGTVGDREENGIRALVPEISTIEPDPQKHDSLDLHSISSVESRASLLVVEERERSPHETDGAS